MQQELWNAVESLRLGVSQGPDGTLLFKTEHWGLINSQAHKLRDKRFGTWYFKNIEPEAMFSPFIQRLRAQSLPYEVEFHGSRAVLLLPKHDERRHFEIMVE
jgi:hypothetical protein